MRRRVFVDRQTTWHHQSTRAPPPPADSSAVSKRVFPLLFSRLLPRSLSPPISPFNAIFQLSLTQMASSYLDNLDSFEPWLIPSSFWFSDAEPLFLPDTPSSVQSFPVSASVSGSDRETESSHKRTSKSVPAKGRVSKRKPRQSKKSYTTYITTDASNFQEMVQQATGVNFSSMSPVLKPKTKRIGAASNTDYGALQYCLPTLDTSAFLLDRHYQQVAGVDAQAGAGKKTCTLPEFDKLACFPTLDSSKVM